MRSEAAISEKKPALVGMDALRPIQRQAVVLLVEGVLSEEQIAVECHVHRNTLHRWQQTVDFDAAYHAELGSWKAQVRGESFAIKERRMLALRRKAEGIEQVFTERAADASMQDVPGGRTGLIVRQIKSVGYGHESQIIEEYAIDVGSIREYRAILDAIASESGQKDTRIDVTSKGEKLQRGPYATIPDEALLSALHDLNGHS